MTSSDSVFDADPTAGLSVDARGGLRPRTDADHLHRSSDRCAGGGCDGLHASDAHSPATETGGFVRKAGRADLPAIGTVHAATMLASLTAGHDGPLPDGVRAMVSAPVVAAGWESAITAPPSRQHHVLVATQDDDVVGLVGLAPTELTTDGGAAGTAADTDSSDSPGGAAGTGSADARNTAGSERAPAAEQVAEITALGVAPERQRRGHGSRLLAAAVDIARQDGATMLAAWTVRGDESLARLLTQAGLKPTGSHRTLPVGSGVTEDCWAARI